MGGIIGAIFPIAEWNGYHKGHSITLDQSVQTFICCHVEAFRFFGGSSTDRKD